MSAYILRSIFRRKLIFRRSLQKTPDKEMREKHSGEIIGVCFCGDFNSGEQSTAIQHILGKSITGR